MRTLAITDGCLDCHLIIILLWIFSSTVSKCDAGGKLEPYTAPSDPSVSLPWRITRFMLSQPPPPWMGAGGCSAPPAHRVRVLRVFSLAPEATQNSVVTAFMANLSPSAVAAKTVVSSANWDATITCLSISPWTRGS